MMLQLTDFDALQTVTPCLMLLSGREFWGLGTQHPSHYIWLCYCRVCYSWVCQSSIALFLTDPNSSNSYLSFITNQKYVYTPTHSFLPSSRILPFQSPPSTNAFDLFIPYLLQDHAFSLVSSISLSLLLIFVNLIHFCIHSFRSDWIIDPNSSLSFNRIIHPPLCHITCQCSLALISLGLFPHVQKEVVEWDQIFYIV